CGRAAVVAFRPQKPRRRRFLCECNSRQPPRRYGCSPARAPATRRPSSTCFEPSTLASSALQFQTLRDRQEAEDVAQEAFIRFHERYPPDASFAAAWLCRTAANIGLTRLRSRRRREHRELDHVRGARYQLVDPEEVLEAREQRRLVRAALRRIAPKKSRVLALRCSGLSYTEVAAALEIRPDQVGTLLRRAEAAFEKELDRAALE